MKWNNLKQNKCPQCNKGFMAMGNTTFENGKITCKCGFSITEKKMSEIVNKLVNKVLSLEMVG